MILPRAAEWRREAQGTPDHQPQSLDIDLIWLLNRFIKINFLESGKYNSSIQISRLLDRIILICPSTIERSTSDIDKILRNSVRINLDHLKLKITEVLAFNKFHMKGSLLIFINFLLNYAALQWFSNQLLFMASCYHSKTALHLSASLVMARWTILSG